MNSSQVLIVDDNIRNIEICREILEDGGKRVISAENGIDALRMAESEKVDVILLDIMMPVMDGYDTLERLKADPDLVDIPVLMLTAKTDTGNIVKALTLGANDYLTKPFVHQELQARVNTLCRLKKAEDKMKNLISSLKREIEMLAHKAELGMQTGGLAHDLSNVMAITQLVSFIPDMLSDPKEHDQIREYVNTALEAIDLGSEISHGYTSYLRDMGEKAYAQPLAPLFQPLSMYSMQFKGQLSKTISPDIPLVKCKADQIKRVIINLFVNASHAVEGKEDATIEFKVWHKGDKVFCSVTDNGSGIAKETLPHIFEECFTTKKNGTGLGLFMAKQVVESSGGTIDVTSELDMGTVFTLSFPVAEES